MRFEARFPPENRRFVRLARDRASGSPTIHTKLSGKEMRTWFSTVNEAPGKCPPRFDHGVPQSLTWQPKNPPDSRTRAGGKINLVEAERRNQHARGAQVAGHGGKEPGREDHDGTTRGTQCERRRRSPKTQSEYPSTFPCQGQGKVEAAPGFEPGNHGFANRCLTTWLCRLRPIAVSVSLFAFHTHGSHRPPPEPSFRGKLL